MTVGQGNSDVWVKSLLFNYLESGKAEEKRVMHLKCVSFFSTVLFRAIYVLINISLIMLEMRT
jgi:hypothetical protein